MSDNKAKSSESSTNNKKLKGMKTKMNIIAVGVGLLILLTLGVAYNNNRQFESHVVLAEKFLSEDQLNDAAQNYQLALDFKNDTIIQEKLALTNKVIASNDFFDKATEAFNNGDYLKAYNNYKRVIPEDIKRYESAQTSMAESRRLYTDEEFQLANAAAGQADYQKSIDAMNSILKIDPNNEVAKSLKAQYQSNLK